MKTEVLPLLTKGLSTKTIKGRWAEFKSSAVFLYVDNRFFDGAWRPLPATTPNLASQLRNMARDTAKIVSYLRTCDYVGRKISASVQGMWDIDLSRLNLGEPLRPATMPLSPGELARMADYKARLNEFENG